MRALLWLFIPLLSLAILFILSTEEQSVIFFISNQQQGRSSDSQAIQYITTSSRHGNMLNYTSRFDPKVTDSMFAHKQALLNALSQGSFVSGGRSADDFRPDSLFARQVYLEWSNKKLCQECVANARMFLTGTSFQRSILWSLVRWLQREELKDKLPDELRLIASVPALVRAKVNGECDPMVNGTKYDVDKVPFKTEVDSCLLVKNAACEHPGPAGVELHKCGLPMSAKWIQDGLLVMYQFKTYVQAPAVDHRIFAIAGSPKPWNIIWIESGEWGSWGSVFEREKTTYQESLDFLKRVMQRTQAWIIVSGNSAYTEQNLIFLSAAKRLASETYKGRLLVFDQKPIVLAGRKEKIPEGHGYYGVLTDVMVRIVMAIVCEATWQEE